MSNKTLEDPRRPMSRCPTGAPKWDHDNRCKCSHFLDASQTWIDAELNRLGKHSMFAARLRAHEALQDKVSCNDPRPGIRHDWVCDDVTEAIFDAFSEKEA